MLDTAHSEIVEELAGCRKRKRSSSTSDLPRDSPVLNPSVGVVPDVQSSSSISRNSSLQSFDEWEAGSAYNSGLPGPQLTIASGKDDVESDDEDFDDCIPPPHEKLTTSRSSLTSAKPSSSEVDVDDMPGTSLSLLAAFKRLTKLTEAMGISPAVRDRAYELYYKYQKAMRGRRNDGFVTAVLYVACRQEGIPRTFKEISNLTHVSKKEFGRCYKLLRELVDTNLGTISTEDFVSRFCGKLHLPDDVMKAATFAATRACQLGLVEGKCPISVAAAAIYTVSELTVEKRTQKDVAVIAGVSEVTIRNIYKDLYAHRTRLLPESFVIAKRPKSRSRNYSESASSSPPSPTTTTAPLDPTPQSLPSRISDPHRVATASPRGSTGPTTTTTAAPGRSKSSRPPSGSGEAQASTAAAVTGGGSRPPQGASQYQCLPQPPSNPHATVPDAPSQRKASPPSRTPPLPVSVSSPDSNHVTSGVTQPPAVIQLPSTTARPLWPGGRTHVSWDPHTSEHGQHTPRNVTHASASPVIAPSNPTHLTRPADAQSHVTRPVDPASHVTATLLHPSLYPVPAVPTRFTFPGAVSNRPPPFTHTHAHPLSLSPPDTPPRQPPDTSHHDPRTPHPTPDAPQRRLARPRSIQSLLNAADNIDSSSNASYPAGADSSSAHPFPFPLPFPAHRYPTYHTPTTTSPTHPFPSPDLPHSTRAAYTTTTASQPHHSDSAAGRPSWSSSSLSVGSAPHAHYDMPHGQLSDTCHTQSSDPPSRSHPHPASRASDSNSSTEEAESTACTASCGSLAAPAPVERFHMRTAHSMLCLLEAAGLDPTA